MYIIGNGKLGQALVREFSILQPTVINPREVGLTGTHHGQHGIACWATPSHALPQLLQNWSFEHNIFFSKGVLDNGEHPLEWAIRTGVPGNHYLVTGPCLSCYPFYWPDMLANKTVPGVPLISITGNLLQQIAGALFKNFAALICGFVTSKFGGNHAAILLGDFVRLFYEHKMHPIMISDLILTASCSSSMNHTAGFNLGNNLPPNDCESLRSLVGARLRWQGSDIIRCVQCIVDGEEVSFENLRIAIVNDHAYRLY